MKYHTILERPWKCHENVMKMAWKWHVCVLYLAHMHSKYGGEVSHLAWKGHWTMSWKCTAVRKCHENAMKMTWTCHENGMFVFLYLAHMPCKYLGLITPRVRKGHENVMKMSMKHVMKIACLCFVPCTYAQLVWEWVIPHVRKGHENVHENAMKMAWKWHVWVLYLAHNA